MAVGPSILIPQPSRDGRLRELSAPWRVDRQLRRLASRPRAVGERFRFAVLGDAEPGRFWIARKLFNTPGVFERQLRAIDREGVDFCVQLGDMVSRGSRRNYERFFADLERWGVSCPLLPVIGNHDRSYPHGRSDSRVFREAFGRADYAFDRGAARFVVLDSSTREVSGRQLRWLDRVLRADRLKCVFTHFPPAPLHRWTARGIVGLRRGGRDLTELFSRRGVHRVYLGHIHAFGVQDYLGVRYVLSGGGGSPLYPNWVEDRYHHYVVACVGPEGVSETLRCADGRSLAIPRSPVVLSR